MAERPHLAILGSRGIPARYGGFETFAEELSVRLVAHGVDVTVFCEGTDGPPEYRGVRLVYVPAPNLGGGTTILHDLRTLWRARREYTHVYMLGYGTSLFCTIPRRYGTPVWMNMDGIEWARAKYGPFATWWWKRMERVAMRVPDLLIADADAVRDALAARHGRLPPTTVIPYGAPLVETAPDPAPLAEWGLEPEQYHLVVCRFEPENHVLEVIEGFAASTSPHPLVVLGTARGDTPYVRAVERAAAQAGSRVRMLGAVYDARLVALRWHAQSYLHGHSVGGTNPSLLEALGCGNAVVAHDNPFNREVAGEAGLYFRTAADVAALVARVEAEPALRATMRTAAFERIRARYTWEQVTAAYLSLLGLPADSLREPPVSDERSSPGVPAARSSAPSAAAS